ncbi:unnamed protein product [Peniophora sp. CBMAI 1063]|nr:unnamed protein product [Peniophora sp. CBMAI 1063]
MAPSQTSFLDLVAQTSAAKDAIKKSKEAKRESKKTGKSEWLKQNKGVNKRAQRDVELRENDLARLSHEQIKARMEQKSQLYDQMKRGDYSGVSDAQAAELLFEPDASHHYLSEDDEDVDESRFVPKREVYGEDEEDDLLHKVIDEFGRERMVRRSELPSEYLPKPSFLSHDDSDSDDGQYVEGAAAAHHFNTYEQTAERLAEIKESLKDEPLAKFFDSAQEMRDLGPAYMKLGATEEERQRNLAALKEAHAETLRNRAEAGAVDVKPGQEGMQASDVPRNSALEKRKREMEARREIIRAKKQKHEADAFLQDVLNNKGSS